ncbi:hypothetical protein AT248_04925 [Bartonella henselae]|nr:hypothetical protein BhenCHDE101_07465 [Bartonella henselae]PNM38988.1 hypothetical protein AL470_006770 [Bartonella henselae str. Houston-1]OLL41150.1 hypothetical protein AT244_00175 [Bartonella henselae]OLL45257.1 hypothetical protein AT245_07650 [Bartonella henselae]OLL46443.1 hypothetical protein AT242_07265 [Bartonella henselae]
MFVACVLVAGRGAWVIGFPWIGCRCIDYQWGKKDRRASERGGEKLCGSVELILKAFYSIQGALEYVALVF